MNNEILSSLVLNTMYTIHCLVYIVFNAEQIVLFYANINGIRSVYSSVVEVIRVMPLGNNIATFLRHFLYWIFVRNSVKVIT